MRIADYVNRLLLGSGKCRRWACTVIVISLFSVLFPLSALAQTRIMLVSDPHVMGPGLLLNEGEAWTDAVTYDRKLNDYSRAIYDEAIAIALREKPDLFLMSGDLTKDGELLSHQYVVKKLEELKAAGIKAYVIPGNHDLGTPGAVYYDGPDIIEAETVGKRQFAELYHDFGYGDESERESSTLTYCCEPCEGLVLIGIDTGHDGDLLNGVISVRTLDWVCEKAEAATAAGKQVLVMMHHSLFPHVLHLEMLSSTYAVKYGVSNGDGSYTYRSFTHVRDRLIASGVRVVLSGHVHASDVGMDSDARLSGSIFDVCTATLAACPNPYRMMTLNEDMSQLQIKTHYITSLPGVDDFATLAEERMIEGLMSLATQYTYDKERARLGADIFLLHVKGDEYESAVKDVYLQRFDSLRSQLRQDPQVKDLLASYSMSFDYAEAMVHSMLEDKTNYGDPERECIVPDLDLTINLREGGWTAMKPVAAGAPTSDAVYTLLGQKVKTPRKGVYIYRGRLHVIR